VAVAAGRSACDPCGEVMDWASSLKGRFHKPRKVQKTLRIGAGRRRLP
jgi:hypothetical protein